MSDTDRRSFLFISVVVAGAAVVKLAAHLFTAANYGLFIDELYFLAAGEHLAWGYVDFPPLTAVQAWLARALFGESIIGIHLFPALAGAGLVILTGAIVHELGGRLFAQAAACLGVLIAPVYLLTDSYLSMNSLEPLFWMGCVWALIRLVKTGEPRWWLVLGACAGLGLLNKHTLVLFGFALFAGILLTPVRRQLKSRWFLFAVALALVIFLPNLIWLIQHGFPHLEQLANIRAGGRNVNFDPLGFLGQQLLFQHPLALPLWLGGLIYFFFHPIGKTYRVFGWTYLAMLAVLLVTSGRPYYLSSAYPVLLAGGAVWFESLLAAPRRFWVKPVSLSLLAAGGVAMAPFSLPVLPPETYIRYAKAVGFDQPRIENHSLGPLPQLFADRFGWPEMAQAAAKVFHALSPEEQARTALFTGNYGQAGAIDFYGPALGLPKALSGHLTYYYWGQEAIKNLPQDTIFIVIGRGAAGLHQLFESVEVAGAIHHAYAMPYNNAPIYLCRGLKIPLEQLWPGVKMWE